MDVTELNILDDASLDEAPWFFKIKFDSERFKLTMYQNKPLVMRCQRTGNIYLGIAEPQGLLTQYPCGTKHFIKYE